MMCTLGNLALSGLLGNTRRSGVTMAGGLLEDGANVVGGCS